jgi:hypothetical protein
VAATLLLQNYLDRQAFEKERARSQGEAT